MVSGFSLPWEGYMAARNFQSIEAMKMSKCRAKAGRYLGGDDFPELSFRVGCVAVLAGGCYPGNSQDTKKI